MRIGFYGNANNYPFMLARALRRLGHEVDFIVLSRDRLNRPEFRYADISMPYPAWINDLSHPLRWRLLMPGALRTHALDRLNACDLVILNEEGPALAHAIRPPLFTLLTGSDLEVLANRAMAPRLRPQLVARPLWLQRSLARLFPASLITKFLIERQRDGIGRSACVNYFVPGLVPHGDALLEELGVTADRRTAFLMTDLELIPAVSLPATQPLRLFSATRLTWVREPASTLTELDYKGSDVMLRGLALARRTHPDAFHLRLVRKGLHVAETQRLAENLGLSAHITWLDPMSQTEIQREFQAAHIVFEHFGNCVLGMAGLDAMATGRPVIMNARNEFFSRAYGEPLPVCSASTPEEVCAHLLRLVEQPARLEEIGRASRSYVERHFSSDVVAKKLLARLDLPS